MTTTLFHAAATTRLRYRSTRNAALLLCMAWAAACDSPAISPLTSTPHLPQATISDGSRGGNPHFFFLPPLVSTPTYTGTADADIPVSVSVCDWNGTTNACDAIVASFSRTQGTGAELVRFDATSGSYIVNWNTDRCLTSTCTLDPTKTFRVRVRAGALELGHADLKIVTTGGQAKNVDNGQYIALVNGRTLPIKFRVETGALTTLAAGGSASVGATGGFVGDENGTASLAIPPGALAATLPISIAPATDAPPAGAWSTPVDLGPDGTTFASPVALTLRFDASKLPSGVPPQALAVYTEQDGAWVEVPNSVVNAVDNTVTAMTTHFSVYWVGIRPNYVSGTMPPNVAFVGQTRTFTSMAYAYQSVPYTYCYWNAYPIYTSFGVYYDYVQQCYTTYTTQYYYPAGYGVFWRSSAANVGNFSVAYSVTDASGQAVSPPFTAASLGTTNISADVGGVVSSPFALTVTTPPVIDPRPQGGTQLRVRSLPGSSGSAVAQVLNAGGYPLANLGAILPAANCYTGERYSWLSLSWSSPTAPSDLTVTANVPAGTPYGVYDLCYTLTGDNAAPRNWGVRVSVQEVIVPNAPEIDPFPQGGTQNVITVRAGEQTTKNVPINNAGGGTLSDLTFVDPIRNCYTGAQITWLAHSFASTTAPTSLILTAAPPRSLTPGTYDVCFELRARSVGAMDRSYGARIVVQDPPPEPTFTLFNDIGTLGGGWSEARGINNGGRIVGGSNGNAWYKDPAMSAPVLINNPYGDINSSYDVNTSGLIAGSAAYVGWVFDPSTNTIKGAVDPFTAPLAMNRSRAYGINDGGLVLACADNGRYFQNFAWNPASNATTLIDHAYNWCTGRINNSGKAVANADPGQGGAAWVWDQTANSTTQVPSLYGITVGNDISASGIVVGRSNVSTGAPHAFRWIPGSTTSEDLGTLGGTSSEATGVNTLGQVVGWSLTSTGETHAFFWDPTLRRMFDLGTLAGTTESVAFDINDSGQVVGYSGSGTARRAVRWVMQ